MTTFQVEKLPEIDQWAIKRGLCPWCLERITPDIQKSIETCPECGDHFVGKLTIED